MPTVLVSWTHQAVATDYQKAVAEAAQWGLRCRYLGKPWQSGIADEAPDLWRDFRTGEMVRLWA